MFEVDKLSRKPIYEQVMEHFINLIGAGVYAADSQMPSVRALSAQLSVNPNTLQKAYAELERKGLCYTVPGSGRYIAKNARELVINDELKKIDIIAELCVQLRTAGVPEETVISAVRRVYEEDSL